MYLSGQFWNPIWADCGEKKPDRTAIKEKQKYNSNTYTKTKINTNTRTKINTNTNTEQIMEKESQTKLL